MPADRNLKFERSNHALTFVRQFDASAEQVYRAHTEPKLIQKWLLGPPGWSMPECTHENRIGGTYRYVWAHPDEQGFGIGGTILDLKPGTRIVHTEFFDGVDMDRLQGKQRAFLRMALGGPDGYDGADLTAAHVRERDLQHCDVSRSLGGRHTAPVVLALDLGAQHGLRRHLLHGVLPQPRTLCLDIRHTLEGGGAGKARRC